MSIFEYNEEQHLKSEREQAYQNGRVDGMTVGLKEGESRLAQLMQILLDAGRSEDLNRVISDLPYREQMYQENNL